MPVESQATWLPPELLQLRLDCNFNNPQAIAARAKIQSLGRVRSLATLAKRISCGPFGSTLTSAELDVNGNVVLVQPTDIAGNCFASDPGWRISNAMRIRKGLALYPPETLVFARVGIYPHCGVIPACIPKSTISSKIVAAVIDDTVSDPYFLMAFFKTQTGTTILYSLQKHTAQPTLGTDELGEALVPFPYTPLQRSIGNKIRAAEKVRAELGLSRATLHEWLNSALPEWELPTEQMSVSPVFYHSLSSERLDAWFNHPRFQQLEQSLSERVGLVSLAKVATAVEDRWSRSTSEIEYIEIGEFDLSQGMVCGAILKGDVAPSRAQILDRRGDVAVSLVRPNRKNIAFIQSSGIRPIVVTSGCSVLRFANPETAALYSVILRHNAVTYQLMRWNTGTSYPAIEQLRLDRIFVPAIPEGQRERLLAAATKAVTGQERAGVLVAAAIADVEHLIEGKLDAAACLEEGRQLAEEFGLEKP